MTTKRNPASPNIYDEIKNGLAPEFRRTSRHSMQQSNAQIITSTPSDLLYDFQNNKPHHERSSRGGKKTSFHVSNLSNDPRTHKTDSRSNAAMPKPIEMVGWWLPNRKWNMKNFPHKSYIMKDRPPSSMLQLGRNSTYRSGQRKTTARWW